MVRKTFMILILFVCGCAKAGSNLPHREVVSSTLPPDLVKTCKYVGTLEPGQSGWHFTYKLFVERDGTVWLDPDALLLDLDSAPSLTDYVVVRNEDSQYTIVLTISKPLLGSDISLQLKSKLIPVHKIEVVRRWPQILLESLRLVQ